MVDAIFGRPDLHRQSPVTPADWEGGVGASWAREWRRTDRSFAGLDPALLRAILSAMPGDAPRIVDIGCGAGATSLAVADARIDAAVTGIDIAPGLIEIAADRARDRPRLDFRHGDARMMVADLAPVDLFVSRHGVMFFNDPVAAFSAFAAAAAPGSAIVFSCFAERAANPWAVLTGEAVGAVSSGGPGPFAFADPGEVGAILSAAGWMADAPERIAYDYVAGSGADAVGDAVDFFTQIGPAAAALRAVDDRERAVLLARLAAICDRHVRNDRVAFPATAWIWTARRQESASS